MTSETEIPDPYDSVLRDLLAKREQIDQTIRMLESIRALGGSTPAAAASFAERPSTNGSHHGVDSGSLFLGMTIADAAKKLLETRRRAMGNADILAALRGGGLIMNSG